MHYVRGLLKAQGRKSIRNLAALFGDEVSEQNLHHFISGSTWDWVPIRRALAQHLTGVTPPQAWVVRPMIIPKSGQHSVGVDKRFVPALGQVLNAQRAIGVWAASEEASVPINWRLHLPNAWLKDDLRRSRVSIPEGVHAEDLSECVVRARAEIATDWELPGLPTVFDTCEADPVTIFGRLAARGAPLLVRIGCDQRLAVTDTVLPASGGKLLSAFQIMSQVKDMRRPVIWRRPDAEPAQRTYLAAAVDVALPSESAPTGAGDGLRLLGVGEENRPWPTSVWLTNMTTVSPASLVRLSRLPDMVDRDFEEISDRVGIRDFTGRSFGGWHRHVTLASAAHAVVALADRAG